MQSGFFIKRLRVQKTAKVYSEVVFNTGLNVISGASDTGKTYIYECIDYLLGAKDAPKNIPEATGYKNFYLELQTYGGQTLTIERILGDKHVTVTDGPIEKTHEAISDGATILGVAKTKASNDKESLPNFLLSLAGFSIEAKLKKNALNDKKELSFRDVVRTIMVDEERILSKSAPFMSGQYPAETTEKSVFRYLISGEDDSELEQIENPEIRRNKLKAKLEYVEEILQKINVRISDLESEDYKVPSNVRGYEFLFGDISKVDGEIQKLSSKRATALQEKDSLDIEGITKQQLLQRFNLLKKHYVSDLARLDFITQGGTALKEHSEGDCNCILCGHELNSKIDAMEDNFIDALTTEKGKIELSLNDIKISIKDTESSINHINSRKTQLSKDVNELGKKIEKELIPLKEEMVQRIKLLMKNEQKQSKLKELRQQLGERTNERDSIQIDLSTNDSTASKGEIPRKKLKEFSEYVQQCLKNWKFIDNEVISIEFEKFDTEIDGKMRGLYGKGKRSLIAAANVISLLFYCVEKGLPHPGFVVLDTPLTPYKDSDTDTDKLTDKVQNAFYQNLASLKSNMQVIVIENKEPKKALDSSINHIHFTGNKKLGRKAFIV